MACLVVAGYWVFHKRENCALHIKEELEISGNYRSFPKIFKQTLFNHRSLLFYLDLKAKPHIADIDNSLPVFSNVHFGQRMITTSQQRACLLPATVFQSSGLAVDQKKPKLDTGISSLDHSPA